MFRTEAHAMRDSESSPHTRRMIFILLCWLLALATALAVVTVRHQNRQAFVAMLRIENEKSELQFENGRLLLERTTWARRQNIVGAARKRLGMSEPSPNEIITLKLEGE